MERIIAKNDLMNVELKAKDEQIKKLTEESEVKYPFLCSKKKRARQKAAKAIRVIINAARELTAAEGVLLENEA